MFEGDSFYTSTIEQVSPMVREVKPPKLPSAPITDSQWKEH